MSQLAPPDVTRGTLRVLYVAAYTTRNWALNEQISRQQIYDLWEAIHELPSVLTHWRGSEEFERALDIYLGKYVRKWKSPDLITIYKQAKENADL